MSIPTHEEVLNHFRRNLRIDVQNRLEEAFASYWKSPTPVDEPIDFKLVVKFDWELHEDQVQQVESCLIEGKWENYSWYINYETGCSELVVKMDPVLATAYTRIKAALKEKT